jgi:hypothetical protein
MDQTGSSASKPATELHTAASASRSFSSVVGEAATAAAKALTALAGVPFSLCCCAGVGPTEGLVGLCASE